ncbi:MAG: AMP-binding protein, partial [Novosphingobium sp.]|nr:AMP-binding protein [Novosphingobium sp.]
FMANSPALLKTWLGINFLGAAMAAPNTAMRGSVLQHLVTLSDAKIALVDAGLLDRFADIDLGEVETFVVAGKTDGDGPSGKAKVDFADAIDRADPADCPQVTVEPWEMQFILFTSGTTGPSKGAIVTYVQMHDMIMSTFGSRLNENDNYMLNMPLFHVSGTRSVMGMMMLGGRFTLIGQFSTSSFWDTAREHGTTACVLLGGAATFLENQPPRDDDADNPMRLVAMLPLVSDPLGWARRFGVDISTSYGMSELALPINSPINPEDTSSCGRLRPGCEARIVDGNDRSVPDGEVGELVLRSERPWSISPGYWKMPEATAQAWRNGWFHTGDMFRRNEAGDYYFVDRKKDAIRRRGENISSYEVEAELLSHPLVHEAAAIGVPSPSGEDNILVAVVLAPDAELPPLELFEYLRPRMAHFMLPHYLRFVDELPKTPSMRVRKDMLRAEGIAEDAWDREAAGITIKRAR